MLEEPEERTIETAVNDFYKLKEEYEQENHKIKKKIIDNPTLSWKEKRNEYQKLKPKCINCKRPGGTLFFCKYHQDEKELTEFRQLKAICGVTIEPCNLNITINVGSYVYYTDALKNFDKEIAEIKKNIIEHKNNLIFGYIKEHEAVQSFNDLKTLLSDYIRYSTVYLDDFLDITENRKQKLNLEQDIEQSYIFINQIKKSILDFNETTNTQFVRDIIHIYDTNLKPLLKKIISSKYKVNFVWYDNKTYHLIQQKNSIQQLEVNQGDEKIISYNVGFSHVENNKRKKERTSQDSSPQDSPSPPPPSPEDSSSSPPSTEDSSSPQESKGGSQKSENLMSLNILQHKKNKLLSLEPSTKEIPSFEVLEYTLNPDGTINWKNYEYEKVWNTFNENLQNALINDKEWLNEFIKSCLHNQQLGEPCKFVSPSNLIVPPQIIYLQNGSYLYDFGNESYNNYFNSLDKTEKDKLLKLYTINDGVKKYDILEETLANELSKIYGLSA
jgi:hypothetical protein